MTDGLTVNWQWYGLTVNWQCDRVDGKSQNRDSQIPHLLMSSDRVAACMGGQQSLSNWFSLDLVIGVEKHPPSFLILYKYCSGGEEVHNDQLQQGWRFYNGSTATAIQIVYTAATRSQICGPIFKWAVIQKLHQHEPSGTHCWTVTPWLWISMYIFVSL